MTKRLRKPELTQAVTNISNDLRNLKTPQPFTSDSLTGYITNSGNVYDYTFTAGDTQRVQVTFTVDHAQNGAVIFGYIYAYNDFASSGQSMGPPTSFKSYITYVPNNQIQAFVPTATEYKWIIDAETTTGDHIYVKVFFYGTDTGTYTITPL